MHYYVKLLIVSYMRGLCGSSSVIVYLYYRCVFCMCAVHCFVVISTIVVLHVLCRMHFSSSAPPPFPIKKLVHK